MMTDDQRRLVCAVDSALLNLEHFAMSFGIPNRVYPLRTAWDAFIERLPPGALGTVTAEAEAQGVELRKQLVRAKHETGLEKARADHFVAEWRKAIEELADLATKYQDLLRRIDAERALNDEQEQTISRLARPLEEALEEALELIGGWREAIAVLEDYCSQPVQLKNMRAALDQIDDWKKKAGEATQDSAKRSDGANAAAERSKWRSLMTIEDYKRLVRQLLESGEATDEQWEEVLNSALGASEDEGLAAVDVWVERAFTKEYLAAGGDPD